MLYLNETNILELGINWNKTIDSINEAVKCYAEGDYAQPVKPYLRYRDLKNRIIAMPAFLGGAFNVSGIKWIASFPKNIDQGKPRANSIIVLNDANTGEVISSINTSLISIIRTASVSGLMIRNYVNADNKKELTIGIIGFGPIGRYHLKMCNNLLCDKVKQYRLYDLRGIDPDSISDISKDKIKIVDNWEEAYKEADILIACTVSEDRYINQKPKNGSLLLNISLRDFKSETYDYVKENIVVDDWEEVCRENTDIELFHKECGLEKNNVKSIADVIGSKEFFSEKNTTMFNPMGMAIFDLAISKHYFDLAKQKNIGTFLS